MARRPQTVVEYWKMFFHRKNMIGCTCWINSLWQPVFFYFRLFGTFPDIILHFRELCCSFIWSSSPFTRQRPHVFTTAQECEMTGGYYFCCPVRNTFAMLYTEKRCNNLMSFTNMQCHWRVVCIVGMPPVLCEWLNFLIVPSASLPVLSLCGCAWFYANKR